jgi:hypothetical protein
MFWFSKSDISVFTGKFPTANFWGTSIKAFPRWCHPRNTLILSLCELSPTPLYEDLVICEKTKVVGRENPLCEHLSI